MLCDLSGRQLGIEIFDTVFSLPGFVRDLAGRIKKILKRRGVNVACEGIGLVVPGMVDQRTGRILNAPTLGWRDVDIVKSLAAATGLPIEIENSGNACALSQLWAGRGDAAVSDLVFVTVSEGVGVGIITAGEVLRGRHNIAGEFGHVPLNIDGPRCSCGATGCWEAYISNLATLSRYFGRNLQKAKPIPAEIATFTIDDLIARARAGDAKALAAIQSTARYLGLGLGS